MIRGQVYVDLRTEPELFSTLDRQRLSILDRCPSGATVIVDLGARDFLTADTLYWIKHHEARLDIVIQAQDPEAVARFVLGGRAGHAEVVA